MMAYRPMRRGSPIAVVYREILGFAFVVFGQQFDGLSRREVARECVDADFGERPDRSDRTYSLSLAALAGTLCAFFISVPLMFLFSWLGWGFARSCAFALCSLANAWSLVGLVRYLADRQDRERWIGAGRPDGWLPCGPAQPKNRDLVIVALLAWVILVYGFLSVVP